MLKNKKGFTIVELIIVIVIIAILAAVLIPTFTAVVKKSHEAALLSERANQKIDDAVQKIENTKWLSWEDFEAELAKQIASINVNVNVEDISDAVRESVRKYLDENFDNNTHLTEDQVRAIVENALEGQLTTAQVRAIVEQAVANLTPSLTKEQVTKIVNDAIAGLPKETGITIEQMQQAIADALGNIDTLTEEQVNAIINGALADALAKFEGNMLTKEEIEQIIAEVLAEQYCVAQVGKVRYDTFKEAYDAAAASGEPIVLHRDAQLGVSDPNSYIQENWSGGFKFEGDITLDLNGHSLVNTKYGNMYDGFSVKSGTLTIEDSAGGGEIRAPHAVEVLYCYEDATLNVYGGTIQAQYWDDYGAAEALRVNGTANIYGGKFISGPFDYYCFAVNNCGITNIYGGEFITPTTYYSGGIANSGDLNIKATISVESLYWTNDNAMVTSTSITVDSGKTFTTDYITIIKANNKSMTVSGDAFYKGNAYCEGGTISSAKGIAWSDGMFANYAD